jgi:hypothetical protein
MGKAGYRGQSSHHRWHHRVPAGGASSPAPQSQKQQTQDSEGSPRSLAAAHRNARVHAEGARTGDCPAAVSGVTFVGHSQCHTHVVATTGWLGGVQQTPVEVAPDGQKNHTRTGSKGRRHRGSSCVSLPASAPVLASPHQRADTQHNRHRVCGRLLYSVHEQQAAHTQSKPATGRQSIP